MKVLKLWMIPLFVFISFSCDNNIDGDSGTVKPPVKIELTPTEVKLTGDSKNFTMELFSSVYELNTANPNMENIVLSPMSLQMALAMVWNGADSETKTAIQKAMGMKDYSKEDVNNYFKKIREAFIETDPTTKLAIANSIWYRENLSVLPDFINLNRVYYNAAIEKVDFTSQQTLDRINNWCSDNTNGLITKMLNEIPADAAMYLLNALYFKGMWSDTYGFDKSITVDMPFNKESGDIASVKMMKQNNRLPYYKDKYLSMTSLPYGNGAFSMVLVLPENSVSLDELRKKLTEPGYWENCVKTLYTRDVDLFLPRFKIEYEIELDKTLEQLGMGIAYSNLADFSKISSTPLSISKVKQKTFLEVNEEGTEAAAVTSIEMNFTSTGEVNPPAIFCADRPFLFAIQENSSGSILFMGKIGSPE